MRDGAAVVPDGAARCRAGLIVRRTWGRRPFRKFVPASNAGLRVGVDHSGHDQSSHIREAPTHRRPARRCGCRRRRARPSLSPRPGAVRQSSAGRRVALRAPQACIRLGSTYRASSALSACSARRLRERGAVRLVERVPTVSSTTGPSTTGPSTMGPSSRPAYAPSRIGVPPGWAPSRIGVPPGWAPSRIGVPPGSGFGPRRGRPPSAHQARRPTRRAGDHPPRRRSFRNASATAVRCRYANASRAEAAHTRL